MAKTSGTTRSVGSSGSSAMRATVLSNNPTTISVPKTAELYKQISNLYNNSSKEQTYEIGNKSATISYNKHMDSFSIFLKENGKLIAKGAKITSDAYTAAGIIRKHIK